MDPRSEKHRQASLLIRTVLVTSTVAVALMVPFFGEQERERSRVDSHANPCPLIASFNEISAFRQTLLPPVLCNRVLPYACPCWHALSSSLQVT